MITRSAAVLLALVLGGCAAAPEPTAVSRDRVILLPSAGGSAGAVVVKQGENETLLDAPYASAAAGTDGALQVATADAGAVRQQFARALHALPAAAASFTVHFVFGQDELTEESRKAIAPVLDDIARRPAPEVTVTGHADQVGSEQVNDALSLQRAERVKQLLVQRGVPASSIVAVGRGSREPYVRAPDGVAEPRNRRAEISIR